MAVRNSFAQIEGASALLVCGRVAADGVTLSNQNSPLAHQVDVSSVKNGTGDYTITINPFKAPLGNVVVQLTPGTVDIVASVGTVAYTGESLAVQVKSRSVAASPAATDSIVHFEIYAF